MELVLTDLTKVDIAYQASANLPLVLLHVRHDILLLKVSCLFDVCVWCEGYAQGPWYKKEKDNHYFCLQHNWF